MYCLNPFIPSRFLPELLKYFGTFLVISGFCTRLSGQIQAGQLYVGGSFSFKTYVNDQTPFNIDFKPELGMMISSKWSCGLGIPFSYSVGYENGLYDVYFAPFVRHYTTFKPNIHLITQFKVKTRLISHNEGNIPFQYSEFQLVPLLNYMIGSRFAIESSFGGLTYVRSKNYDFRGSFYAHSFRAEFRLFPSLTIRYYFPKGEQTN